VYCRELAPSFDIQYSKENKVAYVFLGKMSVEVLKSSIVKRVENGFKTNKKKKV
jgi:hypothetical protein